MTHIARYLYGVVHRATSTREFHRQIERAVEAAEQVPGGAVLLEYMITGHDVVEMLIAALNGDDEWFSSVRPIGAELDQVDDMPPQREPLRLVPTPDDEAPE